MLVVDYLICSIEKMENRLFVGGLPYSTTSEEIRGLFAEAGTVVTADVITDRESGRSKGFAFVQMETPEEAQAAIARFNETELGGRRLVVNIARPKEDRPAPRDFRGQSDRPQRRYDDRRDAR